MNDSAAATARLERLDRYLQQDPYNITLLADAWEIALACGAHERAAAYLDAAERVAPAAPEWTFRRAQLCLVRRELERAAALLQRLIDAGAAQPAVVHDLAYVRFLQQDFAGCRSLLQGALGPCLGDADPSLEAFQVLWLRASHRLQALEEAWTWARQRAGGGGLAPAAKGVASLLAVDLGDFDGAREFADAALAADPLQLEALVARGCVALAAGELEAARQLLQRALQLQPEDGRIWSALGYASLHAGELALAQSQLERAVGFMDEHIGTWHALGWARLLQGDRAGARAAFEHALALDRNFAESHAALGLVLALAGEGDPARRHLELADRLDARNVTGGYARALLAGDAGDAHRLQALARRLLDRPGLFGRKLSDAVISRTPQMH